MSVNSCLRICMNVSLLFMAHLSSPFLSLSHQLNTFLISVPPLFTILSPNKLVSTSPLLP